MIMGVRIRQFLRTDRFGWPEVSHFADGRTSLTDGKDAADFRPLHIVMRRAGCRGAGGGWHGLRAGDPKVRAAIAQVAARYQIPAELTGVMPPPAPAAPSGLTAMICGECCELNAGRGLLFGDAERQLMVSSQQNRHGP